MPVSSVTEHWIKQDALTINLNHFGDPDYLQVSVLAGAVVMAFKQDVIGYNAAHNYRTWPLEAANTYLETSSAYNVYARLTRSEVNARALIVYDTVLRDIEGREIFYANDGSEQVGESDPEFFYIFLGQISGSINNLGEKVNREWTTTLRFGVLDTTEQKNDLGLLFNQMFVPHFDNPNNPEELTWIEALSNLCVAGGLTSYLDNKTLNLPSIYDGLPIDWSTIYWEEVKDADGNVTGRVLKAAAGSSGEGGDVVVSGITVEQLAAYLSTNKYATQPWVDGKGYLTSITSAMVTGALGFTPFDAASFTKANIKSKLGIADWALASSKPSYTYSEISGLDDELSKYIPISGYTEVLGEKNFVGGLKVNGCPLVYDATNKYWKLEGDLLVTGGVTSHASDSAFKPSTIMDALVLDSTTLGINDDGQLYVKSGTGGLTEVHWSDVIDRPTKLSQFTDDIVSGKYLPLSGGTINSTEALPITISNNINNGEFQVGIRLLNPNKTNTNGNTNGTAQFGYSKSNGVYMFNYDNYNYYNCAIGITDDGIAYVGKGGSISEKYEILHKGNYSSYALPYTGGRLSNSATSLFINRTTAGTYPHITFESQGKAVGDIGVSFDGTKPVWYNYSTKTWNAIITSDNYSSYALPLTGGIIKGSSDTPLQIKSPIYGFVGLNLFTDETLALHLGYWDKLGGVRFENLRNQSKSGIGVLDDGLVVQYSYDDSYNFTKNKIWHEGNHGSGSGLSADMLDGYHWYDFYRSYIGRINEKNVNTFVNTKHSGTYSIDHNGQYSGLLLSFNRGAGSVSSIELIAPHYDFHIYGLQARIAVDNARYSALRTFAFTDSNVASATKLQTARTIWGQSFDGTKDISGVISGATTVYFAGGTTYYLGSTGNINCLALTANGATTLKSTLGVTGAVTMESNLLVKGHVTSYSQRSLKNVIDERGLSLEELVNIKPTRYTWKDGRDELLHIGGIADDVQKVLPEVVFSNNGTLTMDYAMAGFAIAASLIKPVAKHEEDIESLKKRIKELEMEVERLTMN